ncbi:LLM class flavin-dependent oxidoreductase [Parahaliea maris]|uniref:LLM class flavin-dependent oxidoreductase n=1 Tax=Parahaliea maris TaxID=2716870 RepID=A0A5C8ZQQ1_9GAMM|nr:LLM class flavin-dependent oxidoreductase [Parahaliea maris]TXS89827.1 LLM class flavin-dependent oxidoreductase [Parahaliea maris]
MKISLGVPPGPHARPLAQHAENLGYDRIWLFDSAAIYEDIWIHLAQIAEATNRIGLGTSVLVPSLRHVMSTASAIATIERLAPGRLACGWGTGMTARHTLGQKALTWKYTRTYIEQIRALLLGETVEIEGQPCKMMHHPAMGKERPIEVPHIISAFGPKGVAIAREIGDGWIGSMDPPEPFDWAVRMLPGTVLDPGESPYSERVFNSAGVWHSGVWHSTWEWDRDTLPSIPGGAAFLKSIEQNPVEPKYFSVHQNHMTHLNEADRCAYASIDGKPEWSVWVGEADQILEKAQEAQANGVSDLLFTPAGDYLREAEAFYNAVKSLQR